MSIVVPSTRGVRRDVVADRVGSQLLLDLGRRHLVVGVLGDATQGVVLELLQGVPPGIGAPLGV